MLLDHNHKSTCKFAEDIVAYLYGEIKPAEKLRFEQHLTSCNSCTDELSGFLMVRASVIDWNEAEFSQLATPIIEIPYEQKVPVRNFVTQKYDSPSLMSKIRAFFNFSPMWTTAVTGLAVLLICVGLVFVVINSQKTDDRAASNKDNDSNVKIQTTPTVENKNTNSKNVETNTAVQDSAPKIQNDADKPEITTGKSSQQINQPTPIKVSTTNNPVKPGVIKSPKIGSSNENKVVNKTNKNSPKSKSRPTLSGEEDETETLRLSDIFEEIGKK